MKLFLDDIRNPPEKGWVTIRRIWMMKILLWLNKRIPFITHVSLDHDLGDNQPTGYDLVKWMAEFDTWPTKAVHVHSRNPVGAASMVATINRYFHNIRA